MKIAFVGKGGSGKSSISWLAIKTLEDMGASVLAIDADHNMDLTSNLGLDPETTVLMRTTDKEFMEKTLNVCDGTCKDGHTNHEHHLPTFSLKDDYTKSITTPISKNLNLINIGLGSPDVLFTSTCAHGLSGPLKYYLGLLDENDSWVIIDSVAGADMLNYGLYSGIDAVIGIVEPHRNSLKVFEQIQDICRKTMIPCYAIMNRPADNEFYAHFCNEFKTITLGEIPFDSSIVAYNYQSVTEETKTAMKNILEKIKSFKKRSGLVS
jgi:CO dehydrogenase nickel-insertion accessory protein CooC1